MLLLCGVALVSGCGREPPPSSVQELVDDPISLEAAMVRCAQNRSETRYEAECVNARQAVSIIEAKEERARREAFEKQSTRKREALRRTQEAAAEARRRATAAARRAEEAEYLAQFGELPPPPDGESAKEEAPNAPGAVLPQPQLEQQSQQETSVVFDELPPRNEAAAAADGGNAPAVQTEPPTDLGDVRDELRRRNEETTN